MSVFTTDEIRALHERYAPSPEAFTLVWDHCRIVAELAAPLAAARGLDTELVRAGALLHDLGVHLLAGDHYIRHGILGHELLRGLGADERLSRFCSCHTGVGLTTADIAAQGLPLPPGDYVAVTAEEKVVMYADKFHSKSTPPRFLTAAAYLARAGRFGTDKADAFRAMVDDYGEPDLAAAAARWGHRIDG